MQQTGLRSALLGGTDPQVTRVGLGAPAIVGARDPGQVDGWIGGATPELTTAEVTVIADAVRRTGAGHGRG